MRYERSILESLRCSEPEMCVKTLLCKRFDYMGSGTMWIIWLFGFRDFDKHGCEDVIVRACRLWDVACSVLYYLIVFVFPRPGDCR